MNETFICKECKEKYETTHYQHFKHEGVCPECVRDNERWRNKALQHIVTGGNVTGNNTIPFWGTSHRKTKPRVTDYDEENPTLED